MTRKDYIVIAKAISDAVDRLKNYGWFNNWSTVNAVNEVAWHIAMALRNDNSNFKERRFYEACGLDINPDDEDMECA